MGKDKEGAQQVGTGIDLGGISERRLEGNSRREAARKREAVVKVIANATAKQVEREFTDCVNQCDALFHTEK